MPTALRTLDAIHVASALMFRENKGCVVTFATHDLQQSLAARSFGFPVIGIKSIMQPS